MLLNDKFMGAADDNGSFEYAKIVPDAVDSYNETGQIFVRRRFFLGFTIRGTIHFNLFKCDWKL